MRAAGFLAALLLAAAPVHAELPMGGGSTSAVSFKLARGARPVSLGNAYLALASGADSVLWNPAGLNQLRTGEATFGHLSYLDGVNDDYLLMGLPIYGLGAWGLGLSYLYASDEGYDNWGNKGADFQVFDFSAQASFAYEGPDDFHVGATYKILRQGYATQFSMGSAFDLGLQWRGFFKRLDFGAGLFNVGTPIALGSTFGLPPLTWKGGASLRLGEPWTVAAEFEHQPLDHFNKWHAGTEYAYALDPVRLALRAGYTLGPEQALGALAGLAAGFGVAYGAWTVDYALSALGDLGLGHRLSLTWRSGAAQ